MGALADRDMFWRNAASLLETAQAGSAELDAGYSILIGEGGEIRMIAASDWPLDSLQRLHGASMAYRVSRERDRVRVEGRAGVRTCLFEAGKPDGAARLLLNSRHEWPGPVQSTALPALTGSRERLLTGSFPPASGRQPTSPCG